MAKTSKRALKKFKRQIRKNRRNIKSSALVKLSKSPLLLTVKKLMKAVYVQKLRAVEE